SPALYFAFRISHSAFPSRSQPPIVEQRILAPMKERDEVGQHAVGARRAGFPVVVGAVVAAARVVPVDVSALESAEGREARVALQALAESAPVARMKPQ